MALRLALPRTPYWLDLPGGVRLHVRPCTTPLYQVARARAVRRLEDLSVRRAEIEAAGGEVRGVEDLSDDASRAAMGDFLLTQELASEAVIGWEGIEAEEGGPAPCTPENVRRLMMLNGIAEAFMQSWPRHLEAAIVEGKSSPAGPSGTSAPAGATTAPDAPASPRHPARPAAPAPDAPTA